MSRPNPSPWRSSRWLRFARALPVVLVAGGWAAAATVPPRFDKALADQQRRVAENPRNVAALNDLGNLLVHFGELEAAETAYRRALEVDPSHLQSRYNLALALLEGGRKRDARGELARVVERAPNHAWAHYQLGAIHAEQGRRRQAIRAYAAAFAHDGSLADPINNPHVVGNPLATQALLRSYEEQLPAVQVPRAYAEPQRVAESLLPTAQPVEPVESPEPTFEPVPEVVDEPISEAESRRGRRFRASFSGGGEAPEAAPTESSEAELDEPIDEAEAELAESDDEFTEEDESGDFDEYDEQLAEEESFDDEGEDEDRARSGVPAYIDGVVSGSSTPPDGVSTPREGAAPRPSRRNPPPVSATPRSPAELPDNGGAFSTGRLDLELFPSSDPQPAVIAG